MLLSLKQRALEERIPWETLLKEAVQVFFLGAFYSLTDTLGITFQGGTSIRLVHGGPRHSEDLDFVSTDPAKKWDALVAEAFAKAKKDESYLEGSLELARQRPTQKISRWRLIWKSAAEGRKVFVRVEIASFPALTRELRPLVRPEGFPTGSWVVIPVETKEEILADKITAIAGRPYIKGRDFFDLWFLVSKGTELDTKLLLKKLKDYNTSGKNLLHRLSEVTPTALQRDLSSFLPAKVREPLEKENYRSLLDTATTLLSRVNKELYS